MVRSRTPSSIRSSASTRNSPTPPATDRISTLLGMDCTWLASTCRSGSETVISTPRTKPESRMSHSFRVLVSLPPTCCPMGSMASSAPRVKNIIPMISSTPPNRNDSRMLLGMGATETLSSSTMAMMGTTALRDSFNFSDSRLRYTARFLSPPGAGRGMILCLLFLFSV